MGKAAAVGERRKRKDGSTWVKGHKGWTKEVQKKDPKTDDAGSEIDRLLASLKDKTAKEAAGLAKARSEGKTIAPHHEAAYAKFKDAHEKATKSRASAGSKNAQKKVKEWGSSKPMSDDEFAAAVRDLARTHAAKKSETSTSSKAEAKKPEPKKAPAKKPATKEEAPKEKEKAEAKPKDKVKEWAKETTKESKAPMPKPKPAAKKAPAKTAAKSVVPKAAPPAKSLAALPEKAAATLENSYKDHTEVVSQSKLDLSAVPQPGIAAIKNFTFGWDAKIRAVQQTSSYNAARAKLLPKYREEFTPEVYEQSKEKAALIDAAYVKAKPHAGTVYRGIKHLSAAAMEHHLKTDVISFDAHTSTALDADIAMGFAGLGGRTFVVPSVTGRFDENGKETGDSGRILYSIKQKSGISIEGHTESSFEFEVLMRKGTKFRVTGRHRIAGADNAMMLELEEI